MTADFIIILPNISYHLLHVSHSAKCFMPSNQFNLHGKFMMEVVITKYYRNY
jgi:hypothetical protein